MRRLREGLIAAVHTPFDASLALDLAQVERLASHVADQGLNGVFVGSFVPGVGSRHSTAPCRPRSCRRRRGGHRCRECPGTSRKTRWGYKPR